MPRKQSLPDRTYRPVANLQFLRDRTRVEFRTNPHQAERARRILQLEAASGHVISAHERADSFQLELCTKGERKRYKTVRAVQFRAVAPRIMVEHIITRLEIALGVSRKDRNYYLNVHDLPTAQRSGRPLGLADILTAEEHYGAELGHR